MTEAKAGWQRIPFLRMATPRGLCKVAFLIVVVFVVSHLAGLRDYTSFFSGTWHEGQSTYLPLLLGFVYTLAYLGFVVAVPVLLLAAGLFALFERLAGVLARTSQAPPAEPEPGSAP